MFFKKKPAPVGSPINYTFATTVAVPADDDMVTVKRGDHFVPRSMWDFRLLFSPGQMETYKDAYEGEKKRTARLEAFLDDLLIIDPPLRDRFNGYVPDEYADGDDLPQFEWDFEGAHAAADVLRSDAADAKKREAVKKFQGKK